MILLFSNCSRSITILTIAAYSNSNEKINKWNFLPYKFKFSKWNNSKILTWNIRLIKKRDNKVRVNPWTSNFRDFFIVFRKINKNTFPNKRRALICRLIAQAKWFTEFNINVWFFSFRTRANYYELKASILLH